MKISALLAAFGLPMTAASAEAAVFTVTYTGKVTFGGDEGNYFGLGAELSTLTPNATVTLQFTIDPDKPGSRLADAAGIEQLDGYGQAGNPFILSSFTLNGRTILWSNSPDDGYDLSYGFAEQANGPGSDDLFHSSFDYERNADSYDTAGATIFGELNDIVRTTDVSAPLEYDVQSGDTAYGSFGSFRSDPSTGGDTRSIGINFDVTHVSIASAVPEPSSWAMLIAGFGLAGGALRRRRPDGEVPSQRGSIAHNRLALLSATLSAPTPGRESDSSGKGVL